MRGKIAKSICMLMTLCMLGSSITPMKASADGLAENTADAENVLQEEVTAEDATEVAADDTAEELENLALQATASSTSYQANYPASFLNDGNHSGDNAMLTEKNVALPVYLTFNWEEPQTFNTVNMVTWWSKSQAPSNWDIEISEDGESEWTRVASSGDVEWEESSRTIEQKAVSFPTVEGVKGLRIIINKANLEWEGKFVINEIEVFNDSRIANEKTLQSIEITRKPSKTLYNKGEELDLTGLEVTAYYANATTEIVTEYEVTGYDKDTAGKQAVEVTYAEGGITVSATFNVTVRTEDSGDSSAPIINDPDDTKWVYQFGDEFDEPELSDMWEPSYFAYWSHSSITPQSVYSIEDGVLKEIVNENSPYYDATTDYGFRNPGMSLGVRDYVHMYRDNLVQYRHMPTDDRYVTKYGYYELRAKLNNKDGSCAAWWMTGFQDNPTETAEIDIIEFAGNIVNGKNKIGGWMYNWSDPKLTSVTNSPVLVDFDPSADYHVYGMEWAPGYLKFYVDGELMSTINQSPDYRMITWLSYNHHDSLTNDTFPKEWGIDYFRVWQNEELLEEETEEEQSDNLALSAYASTVGITASHYKKSAPVNMNDGDETTYYQTPDSSSYPYYLYLDWMEPQTINTLTMKCSNGANQGPTSLDIEYSEDGKHGWKPIVQDVNFGWTSTDSTVESNTVCFETLKDVQYIRVRVNKANTASGYFAVSELEVGYEPDAQPAASPKSYVENYAPYAAVTATGEDVNYPAGDLADEVYLNEYRSESNPEFPYYLTFNWDEGKSFSEIAMTSVNALSTAPYDFEVQVSADGTSDWTTVAEVKEAGWETDGMYETLYIDFDKVENQKGCRIKVNAANTDKGYFKLSEIEVNSIPTPEARKRKLSENDNLAIFAVASSTDANSQYPAKCLNDGNIGGGMVSVNYVELPSYQTFTWAKPQTFNTVNMITWFSKDQAPTNWDIEVSEDGVDNWVKVASSGDVEWAESSNTIENKEVTFPTVTNVKGMRVKINEANRTWYGKYAINEIEVFYRRTLDSIEVTKAPEKTEYFVGEELDLTGMEVTAYYSDETSETVTEYEVTGYNKDTVGKQVLEISYTEDEVTVKTSVTVTVLKKKGNGNHGNGNHGNGNHGNGNHGNHGNGNHGNGNHGNGNNGCKGNHGKNRFPAREWLM